MKKKLFSAFQFVALLAIGITLLWLVFKDENPEQIRLDIRKADKWWVGLSILISLASYFIRAVRWKMLIKPLGYNPKLSNTFYSMMVGYLANLAFPRLGEISKCGALNRSEKIPFDKLVGTVIVERVVDLIALLVCLLIATIIEYDRIRTFSSDHVVKPIIGNFTKLLQSPFSIALYTGTLVLLVLLIFIFRKKILQSKISIKIKKLSIGVLEGVKSVMKMKNSVLYFFLTVLMWILYMLTSYVCFFSLESTSNLGLNAGIFILVAGGIGMAAPVQGGIGAFEGIVALALTMYNVDFEKGKIYAVVLHGSQTIFAIVLGFLSLLLLYFSRRKMNHANT